MAVAVALPNLVGQFETMAEQYANDQLQTALCILLGVVVQ